MIRSRVYLALLCGSAFALMGNAVVVGDGHGAPNPAGGCVILFALIAAVVVGAVAVWAIPTLARLLLRLPGAPRIFQYLDERRRWVRWAEAVLITVVNAFLAIGVLVVTFDSEHPVLGWTALPVVAAAVFALLGVKLLCLWSLLKETSYDPFGGGVDWVSGLNLLRVAPMGLLLLPEAAFVVSLVGVALDFA